jgi:hypothetical protein
MITAMIAFGCENKSAHISELEPQSAVLYSTKGSGGGDRVLRHLDYLHGNEATGIIDSTGKCITNRITKIELKKSEISLLNDITTFAEEGIDEITSDGDCSPEYRDAVVYYDGKGKPIAWTNICMQCERMMRVNQQHDKRSLGMPGDSFDKLARFLKSKGLYNESRPITQIRARHESPIRNS